MCSLSTNNYRAIAEFSILLGMLLCTPQIQTYAQQNDAPQQPYLVINGNVVTLYWQQPRIGSPIAYQVLRGTDVGSLSEYAQVTADPPFIFNDTVKAGYVYYYALSAIRANGTLGKRSTIVSRLISADLTLKTEPYQISAGEPFELILSFRESEEVTPLGYLNVTVNWNNLAVQLDYSKEWTVSSTSFSNSIGLRTVPQRSGVMITLLPKQLSGIRPEELELRIPMTIGHADAVQFSMNQMEAEDVAKKKVQLRAGKLQKTVYKPVIAAPKGLKAVSGNKKVVLTWNPVYQAEVKGYRLWRRSQETKQKKLLSEFDVADFAQPFYVDSTVENHKTYVYSVTALHATGFESHTEGEVSAWPELPFSENMIAYFPFNEPIRDESWNNTAIWYKSNHELDNDRFGRKSAFRLNEESSPTLKIINSMNVRKINHDFTISFWIYADSVIGYRGLASYLDSTTNSGWSISLLNGLPIMKVIYPDSKVFNATALYPISDSVWYQVVWNYSVERQRIELFVNGNTYSESWEKVPMPDETASGLIWGGQANQKERKSEFLGKIDDLRWYNSTLTSIDSYGLYTAEAAPKSPTGLMAAPALSQIELHWNSNRETDFKRYVLYMSESGADFKPVYSTRAWANADSSLVLTGLIEDQEYYLYLTAEDKDGWQSEPSDTLHVVPIDTGFLLFNGLTHYWHFDERFGSSAYDQLNFVPIEASSRRFFSNKSDGIAKTCADLTSGKSWLDLRQVGQLGKSWSVSFWIKWDEFVPYETVIRLHSDANLQYALQRGYSGNGLEFYLNEELRFKLMDKPVVGKWYHLVINQNKPGEIEIIVNGRKSSETIRFNGEEHLNPQAIGTNDLNSLSHFGSFLLDELSIYDRAISLNDIRALYQNGKGLPYPFEDESMYPLFPPVHVRAEPLPNRMLITWQSQEVFHVDYHKIYRGSSPETLDSIGYTPYKEEQVSIFMDSNILPNKTYYYAISVVNLDGKESMLSSPVLATMAAVDEKTIWVDTSSIISPLSFTPTVRFETVPGSIGYVVNVIGPGFFTSDFTKVNGYMIPRPMHTNGDYTIAIQSFFLNDSVSIQGPVTTQKVHLMSRQINKTPFLASSSNEISSSVIQSREVPFLLSEQPNELTYEFIWGNSPLPGKGLNWLNVLKEQLNFDRLNTSGFSASDKIELAVNPGWNMIRNPFRESFTFSDAVSSASPLLFWNGQGFQTETICKPDMIYYWYNDTGSKSISLSYFDLVVLKEELYTIYSDEWDAQWFISSTFASEQGNNSLEIVLSNRVAYPELYYAPLAPFEMNTIHFESRKRSDDIGLPIKFVIPKPSEDQEKIGFTLPLAWYAPNNSESVLISDSVTHWSVGLERYLVNQTKGWIFPMRGQPVLLQSDTFKDDWFLAVGNAVYIEELKEQIKPQNPYLFDMVFEQTHDKAMLRFALPFMDKVKVHVYDVFGKRLSNPVSGLKPSGEHEISIDLKKWENGFYRYELTTPNWQSFKLFKK